MFTFPLTPFMKIIHLRNSSIDRKLWDSCITQSYNQLVYAYSWYLDIVSPGWEALVTENYEFVMPLPVKTKYKISYLVQPILTQQLGVFSKHKIEEDIVEEFIKKIPYFSYEINLNEYNFYSKALVFPNFILNMDQPYEHIISAYSKNTIRNIEKANKFKLEVRSNIPIDDFLDFYYSDEKNYLTVKRPVLEKLIKTGISTNMLTLYGVITQKENLIAGLCLLHSCNMLTNLLPVSNSEGKSASAMFLLIDYLIKNNDTQFKTFDFEGSRIDGVARFYKGFGAKNHPYYTLKRLRPTFLTNNTNTK